MTARRRPLALALVAALALTAAEASGQATPPVASPEELAAARKLFGEALEDEKKKDFAAALAKFKRVREVRDTVPVRYRIASCLEGMGKLASARAAYRAVASPTSYPSPDDADIVKTAQEREAAIEPRVPRLTLEVPPGAPSGLTAKIDGADVPTSEPAWLDPGDHEIRADAPGHRPFASRVSMSEGARVSLRIALERESRQDPPPGRGDDPGPSRVPAYVAFGGGAAMFGGAAVTLVVRQSAISSIESSCPNNVCPSSKRADVTSAQDRAKLMLPLSIGFAAAGAAAVGVGAYFLFAPSRKHAGALLVSPTVGGASVGYTGAF